MTPAIGPIKPLNKDKAFGNDFNNPPKDLVKLPIAPDNSPLESTFFTFPIDSLKLPPLLKASFNLLKSFTFKFAPSVGKDSDVLSPVDSPFLF